jgi:hypothetical protein
VGLPWLPYRGGHLRYDEIPKRYPRLTRALRFGLAMTEAEVGVMLRDYRDFGTCYAEITVHMTGGTGFVYPLMKRGVEFYRTYHRRGHRGSP